MDDQGDLAATYAERRGHLERTFTSLPPAGSQAYWDALAAPSADGQGMPLEVLARCWRKWTVAYRAPEAERIFAIMMSRVDRRLDGWANKIAGQATGSRASGLAEELKQECLLKLWQDLKSAHDFLEENFLASLRRIQQKVANSVMEREGYWMRKGVKEPTRVPAALIDSLSQPPSGGEVEPAEAAGEHRALGERIPAPATDAAFALAEAFADLPAMMRQLSPELRATLLARIKSVADGRTQREIASDLGVTDRTLRNWLEKLDARLQAMDADAEDPSANTPTSEQVGEQKDTDHD